MPENKDIQPKLEKEIKLDIPSPTENIIFEYRLCKVENSLKQVMKELRAIRKEIRR